MIKRSRFPLAHRHSSDALSSCWCVLRLDSRRSADLPAWSPIRQGGILPGVTVTLVGEQTALTRTQVSGSNGFYDFRQPADWNLHACRSRRKGSRPRRCKVIPVQSDRTGTLNVQLKVGAVNTVVSVEAVPLMNAVDTTNGYVLDKTQIQSIPLPTGSFTGLAILSPGVNAELPGGTGALSGLGNAPIWANGQRDTSNSFSLNGVDASNLFNGKSTSQVASARVINSTGASTSTGGGGVIQTTASVYLSIGNAIPTPAPETIEEVRVNASMYDAQQGSTSGAHIDMSTSSGTNAYHGTALWDARHQLDQCRAVLLQERPDHRQQSETGKSGTAPLRRRGHLRRSHHQEQALRLRGLSAPAGLRPGDRRLFP